VDIFLKNSRKPENKKEVALDKILVNWYEKQNHRWKE